MKFGKISVVLCIVAFLLAYLFGWIVPAVIVVLWMIFEIHDRYLR